MVSHLPTEGLGLQQDPRVHGQMTEVKTAIMYLLRRTTQVTSSSNGHADEVWQQLPAEDDVQRTPSAASSTALAP